MDENVTTPPADGCTPTHADTPHLLGGDNSQTPHLLGGDIVERLRKSGERPYCYCALFKGYAAEALEAADEIERLQTQVRSQALELLVAHSEPLGLYDITMVCHTPDETVPIEQQHGDYVEEDTKPRPRHAYTKWETVKNNRATPSDIHKPPK